MGSTTIPSSGGIVTKTLNTQIFRSSGTWTYPTSANFDGTVEITVVGGGGSGGNGVRRGGNGTGSNNYATGGGGGGEVITTTVSVLGLGNQTVVVGAGGLGSSSQLGGTCGGFSSFGAVTIANAYPDPETRWGLMYYGGSINEFPEGLTSGTIGNNISIRQPYTSSGSVTPNLGSYLTEVQLTTSGGDSMYSDWFSVTASTSYRIGFSYARAQSNLNAQSVISRIYWYQTDGTYISSSTIGTYTIPTSGTAWTLLSATITTPASAAYGRFTWTSTNAISGNHSVNGLFVTPTSTGITTAVYGQTTNYKWLNSPFKSPTVLLDSKSVLAQGGGGGWGVINNNTSTWTMYYPLLGYTAGGDATVQANTASATIMYQGGHGGGAGGNAEEPLISFQTYNGTTITGCYPAQTSRGQNSTTSIIALSSYTGPYQWCVTNPSTGGGYGSQGYQWTTESGQLRGLAHWGSNGAPVYVDGQAYGAGGLGGQYNGHSVRPNFRPKGGVVFANSSGMYPGAGGSSAYQDTFFDAAANTGNGGNGIGISGGTQVRGGHGGSGIVIVKWYT